MLVGGLVGEAVVCDGAAASASARLAMLLVLVVGVRLGGLLRVVRVLSASSGLSECSTVQFVGGVDLLGRLLRLDLLWIEIAVLGDPRL